MADRGDHPQPITTTKATGPQYRCTDCAAPFVVAVPEATYYHDRSLPGPTRCRPCRATRRAERNAGIRASLTAAHESAQPRGQDRG
ncbi:MAG: zinc-ribbon domain-containing protein, partial [Chloroflexota bacterium]|nr:zinc-ribbon domain-containing protein [Chloroflexota bacterium]